MDDTDTNLADPSAYDLIPVDHTPQFSDAPVPKAGQTVQQPNVMGDISSMPGKVASAVGDVTGVSDAYKAATGQMTPEEAQMFALGALPMLAGGPEAKVAEEAGAAAASRFPRTFWRGDVPGDARRISTGVPSWDNNLFVSSDKDAASMYGPNLTQYNATPDAKILYEGTRDFVNTAGKWRQGESLLDYSARAAQAAKDAGYDAVHFKRQGDVGTAIFNPEKFVAQSPEPPPPSIRAFHGSPYDFNQFDLSKIGTGEGAQAYGHGLYFAENPETALSYRNQLAPRDVLLKRNGKAFDPLSSDDVIDRVTGGELVESQYPTFDSAISAINKKMAAYDPSLNLPDYNLLKQMRDRVQDWKDSGVKLNAAEKGKMYEVNINADPDHFLDWDKPLSEQSPHVQKVLADNWLAHPEAHAHQTGSQIYQITSNDNEPLQSAKSSGERTASEMLRDAGIPGIKYLDQGSRNTPQRIAAQERHVAYLRNSGAPDDQIADQSKHLDDLKSGVLGTRNYVVFNDKIVDIVKKYGLAGLVAGGASHFSTVPVDHQPDFPDQNGMADGGTVDDATDAPTDPNNSIAPLATALNQAVPNFDPEAAGFRPSTNIEDVRNKPLWRKEIEVITRKPLPGDLTNYAKGGSVKATKTQANYRGGTANKRCGICSMFQPPRGCSAVRGVISPQALCDFYEPKKTEKKNDVKIDVTHDGPWMSCMSIDGATMYRNKNVPATANIKGKTVDVDDMLLHHEVPERADLEKLIAEFKQRFHREPNKNERKAIYLKAHNRSGTPNERAHAKKIGVDWKAWSAWCRGEESKIEKMKFTNQPKDADVKPIPHSHEELEAMDHASAA